MELRCNSKSSAKQGDRVIITGAEDTLLSMPDGVGLTIIWMFVIVKQYLH